MPVTAVTEQPPATPASLLWNFPLPRPYAGILLGNGRMGIMVWGTDCLSLTIGRTGFWDRRGGVPFSSRINFAGLRRLLEAGDQEELKKAFSSEPRQSLPYRTPTQLPGGRLDLRYPGRPVRGVLDPGSGKLTVEMSGGTSVEIRMSAEDEVAWIGGSAAPESVELLPSWRWLGTLLASGGVAAPVEWNDAQGGGFFQPLPADPGLAIGWKRSADGIFVATAIAEEGRSAVGARLETANRRDLDREADAWWTGYRASLPGVRIPDPALQRAWDYGVYKQAGMTPPHGVPATLQGPWMAEDELPPWSNDFHFNINLQMIYWPALPTNRAAHFRPLWEMLASWMPVLRKNAAEFFGAPDSLMLPHAVDDRCQVIGNFWQGTIDQACTAWMAQLAWLHYRHSLEESVLRDIAWPLLTGAFEGFWAMAVEIERDGRRRLSLPVSVSAEFGGWGRDASFQLAAFQMLARILPQAAGILGMPADARWQQVREELPPCSAMPLAKVWGEKEPHPRIVLWEGMDLPESHRHHSHLAAIYPFCTMDAMDESHRDLIRRSIEHWAATGPGQWVGWSMPWAAMLWARCNYASAAVSVLRIWEDVFTNEGHGTLHNADSPGYSGWIHGPFFDWPETVRQNDQMQMDAGFGAVQAIAEIFVQQRGETLHVLPSIPKQWRDFEFDGILAEGAFLVGATVREGRLCEVRLKSLAGQPVRLQPGFDGAWRVNDGPPQTGPAWQAETRAGERHVLRAV